MTKRRLLSLLLAICLVMSLVPTAAYAFEPAAQTADFTASDNGAAALALLNAAKTGTEESTWDSTTKILTLKGVNFTTTAITAVKLPADATIVLSEGTENIIASVNEAAAGEYCSFGIYAEGDLTVEGDGALTATGGAAKGRYTYSCGIYAYESNITVSGGAVNAIGGTADKKSFGIFAGNDVIISGGTVYATGSTADSDSYGILAGKNVAITGGTVTAMGGKTTGTIGESCGIYADVERVNGVLVGGTVTIENSNVISTGGEATMSRGIYAYDSVAVSQGADVTATGSTAEKYCTGIQADWDSVTIADSKVIATSNTANLGSDGISTNGCVTITGSADVTATGGTVTRKQSNDDSRGIYADYVTIEGGTIRATGGEESFASYGICTDYDVTITGGTVIARGRAAEMFSDGIYAKGDYDYYEEFVGGGNVTISGGTVTATGDTATRESSGIYAESSVTLSGTAHVTATGSNAEYFSYGIYVNLTKEGAGFTVSGGSLVAQASAKAEGCAALSAEPDLTGYATYWWRTDAQGSYTVGNFVWNDDPCDTYVEITDIPTYPPIIEDTEGGTVTVSPEYPTAGSKVTVTATPDEGYEVGQVIVTDQNGKPVAVTDNGDGTYSFTQPVGKVTVKVVFKDVTAVAFVDVTPNAYYYDAVQWAVKNGITCGTSDTTFSPDTPCTRAQVVTFLWRAAGCPSPQSREMPFKDVVKGSYYETAVLWAVETGITQGTGATIFSPEETCSRAQIVTFLWRSQDKPSAGTANPFTDVPEDSYYTEAVLWAVGNGITVGTSATTFSPDEDCTRAQIVTFLYRCLGK